MGSSPRAATLCKKCYGLGLSLVGNPRILDYQKHEWVIAIMIMM